MDDEREYITTAKQAKKYIGKMVYWTDFYSYHYYNRRGILEEVRGRNYLIDGDWKYKTDLKNFRNFEA